MWDSHRILYLRDRRNLATDEASQVATVTLTHRDPVTVTDKRRLLWRLEPMNKLPWLVLLMASAALTGRTMTELLSERSPRDALKCFNKAHVCSTEALFHFTEKILIDRITKTRC